MAVYVSLLRISPNSCFHCAGTLPPSSYESKREVRAVYVSDQLSIAPNVTGECFPLLVSHGGPLIFSSHSRLAQRTGLGSFWMPKKIGLPFAAGGPEIEDEGDVIFRMP